MNIPLLPLPVTVTTDELNSKIVEVYNPEDDKIKVETPLNLGF